MSDFSLIRDLYKDVYGFRPTESFMCRFEAQTDEEKQAEWNALNDALNETIAAEKQREAVAFVAFNERISGMCHDYTISRGTAMRWDMDAFNIDVLAAVEQHGLPDQEIEFYLYQQGLSMEKIREITPQIKTEFGY